MFTQLILSSTGDGHHIHFLSVPESPACFLPRELEADGRGWLHNHRAAGMGELARRDDSDRSQLQPVCCTALCALPPHSSLSAITASEARKAGPHGVC